MTKDEAIKLAREAGIINNPKIIVITTPDELHRLAQAAFKLGRNAVVDEAKRAIQESSSPFKDAARYLHICEQDFKDRQWVDGFAEFKKARDTTIDAAMGITGEPK